MVDFNSFKYNTDKDYELKNKKLQKWLTDTGYMW